MISFLLILAICQMQLKELESVIGISVDIIIDVHCVQHFWSHGLCWWLHGTYIIIRALFHSFQRNPSLLSVQQCLSLATWFQFGPIASLRLSHQHLFGWPLGHLWSCGHHSLMLLVQLLSFSPAMRHALHISACWHEFGG